MTPREVIINWYDEARNLVDHADAVLVDMLSERLDDEGYMIVHRSDLEAAQAQAMTDDECKGCHHCPQNLVARQIEKLRHDYYTALDSGRLTTASQLGRLIEALEKRR